MARLDHDDFDDDLPPFRPDDYLDRARREIRAAMKTMAAAERASMDSFEEEVRRYAATMANAEWEAHTYY